MRKELTKEQIDWLIENYPNKTNQEIRAYLECSAYRLETLRKKYGLAKSNEFMRERSVINGQKGVEANKIRNWNSQRETMKRLHKEGKMTQRNRISPWSKMTESEKDELKIKLSVARKKLIDDERRRIRWGLEPRTKLRNLNESNPSRRWAKSWLINKKGYKFIEKWVFGYDSKTKRNLRVEEKHAKRFNFKFIKINEEDTDITD